MNNIMAINYLEISEAYRPEKIGGKINKLLVSEALPPNGESYFYVPRPMSNNILAHNDRSLPATIFCHYFKRRPETLQGLNRLKKECMRPFLHLNACY